MNRNLKSFKKVTCILGILFLLLGMVPVPVISQITKVSAGQPDCVYGEWSACTADCGGGTRTKTLVSGPGSCAASITEPCNTQACEPAGDDDDTCTPAGTEICPTACGLSASTPSDGCGGVVSCPATDPCAPTCQPTGSSCTNDADCCSGNICAGEGICKEKGEEKCKEEGDPCGGANQCCTGLICGAVDGSENEKCYIPAPVCGDGVVATNEQCDDGNTTSGDGCSSSCIIEYCGDGTTQEGLGEFCDDGNNLNNDGCSADCLIEYCGDGIQQTSEECDDGNTTSGDGCDDECVVEYCGDGITQEGLGEECDDGNTTSDDGCNAECKDEYCGDGVQQSNERCDDGNNLSGDGCSAECVPEVCGDGIVQTGLGELCDDGNTSNNDGCNQYCQPEFCGDGVLQLNEGCDDGNTTSGDGCSAGCVVEYCGDGVLQTGLGEVCDDGNDINGDGCNDECQPEICGNGVLDAGEECDDGNTNDNDGCSALCLDEYCGDGIVQTALQEACDDGNDIDDDECTNTCQLPTCGDGIWQEGAGEECDGDILPEDAPDGAVCNAQCVLEYCGDGITNGEEDCDGEAWCTETCEMKELLALVIDPYCATKAGVGAVLNWSFMNPNGFTVPVSWTLDGAPHGPVMVGAGVNYFAGDTLDAPPSHTMTAWIDLPGGPSETFTSNKECEVPPPPPPPGELAAPIPVTGAGGPTEPLIIPVTGLNLMLDVTGLQKLFTYMGLMMFGITMMLEGVERKLYKID